MIRYRFGDVLLLRLDFHQTQGSKVRPVIVLLDSGDDDVVVAPVTSRPQFSEFDLPVLSLDSAGLVVASWVRVHKIAVVPKQNIVRGLGRLDDGELEKVKTVLKRALGLG